jgi:cyclopropane fatty-acyl-phospholipid synthase-like methyltransferase
VSTERPQDVSSPIDFGDTAEAREWARTAEQRPGRNEILARLTEEARRLTEPGDRILELGSGPGFLAERLLQRLPDVQYTALDFSAAMHEMARARLEPWCAQVTFLERDFKTDSWTADLGPFSLVVTNQAVHELRHKRHAAALHRQVFEVLVPEGSYLVSDHFSDPGGLQNAELYMTRHQQAAVLREAGFASAELLLVAGSLALHHARKAPLR